MQRKHNHELTALARNLRKNMTRQERRLWYDHLQKHPAKFYKQKVLGKYIADFYCAKAKLIVELDGSQHFFPEGIAYDAKRTKFLSKYGLTVLRIPNNEVERNFTGVCEWIDAQVKASVERNASPV